MNVQSSSSSADRVLFVLNTAVVPEVWWRWINSSGAGGGEGAGRGGGGDGLWRNRPKRQVSELRSSS